MLLSSGAQAALAAVLSVVCKPGDRLVVEPLSYPGIKAAAAQLGVQLVVCPVDDEGFVPGDLERLCREARPTALY